MTYRVIASSVLCLVLNITNPLSAQESVDYVKQIKPVLQARCYACHGALKQEGNLRLDTAAAALKGGDGGAVIKAGDAKGSELIKRLTAIDVTDRMPPEGEPLTKAQVAAISLWIQQGAKAPTDEQPERDPRDHWSFKVPARPQVPTVKNQAWVKNPIDAFILAKLEEQQLVPQRAADKRTLLRRVSLDLIGLPPSLDEQEAFVADTSADAYEKAVERLLASKHYGERWGRHFMDLWRYSDWWGLGAEVRNSQKHIWHWRDWIIESLNADKGYDQMIKEMLAADELYPNDMDRLRGSGFLARQYFKFNRTTWLDDTIEHTSKAFLGLTFNCAKCHDHKYDPLSQTEYYQLRAFFEPYQLRTDLVPNESNFEKNGIPRAFDCNLDAVTYLHVRGDDRNPDKSKPIVPVVPAFLARDDFKIEPVTLPLEAHQPGLRAFIAGTHLASAARAIEEAKTNLAKAKADLAKAEALKAANPEPMKKPVAVVEAKPTPTAPAVATPAKLLVKDDFAMPQPEIWLAGNGEWKHENGKLIQSAVGATRHVLRLKSKVPENFEAKFKFAITGGQMWKSVGIAFDLDDKHEQMVYLSAVAGGAKLQASYKHAGNTHYPSEGLRGFATQLKTPYELHLKVKERTLNVAIDGQHLLAYRAPLERKAGAFELVAFDAAVEFLSFELSELASNAVLMEPDSAAEPSKPTIAPATTYEQAVAAVTVAEKVLAAAEAEPQALQARIAADRAKYSNPQGANLSKLAQEAARLEKSAALLAAEAELSQAELALAMSAEGKKAAPEKRANAARTALANAKKAAEAPGENYTSLRGALKTLENNLENEASRMKPFPTTSTGRRTALAQWIASQKNPLTARVIVNHLWSRHTGRPIVATVFDFGRKGAAPSHPELLDWMAVELMDHQWSLKRLHRLIVTSNAYRQSSSTLIENGQNLAVDPDNKLFWHMQPIRMEAQIVRDSLLALSGELDLTLGGPTIPANDDASKRRSLYFTHSNNDQNRFLQMFDDAKVQECYRRAESIVPQQALALENSRLANQAAEKVAAKLNTGEAATSDAEFVRRAFSLVLSAEPSSDEREQCLAALKEWRDLSKSAPDASFKARMRLVHALLNHNDFVTVR